MVMAVRPITGNSPNLVTELPAPERLGGPLQGPPTRALLALVWADELAIDGGTPTRS